MCMRFNAECVGGSQGGQEKHGRKVQELKYKPRDYISGCKGSCHLEIAIR